MRLRFTTRFLFFLVLVVVLIGALIAWLKYEVRTANIIEKEHWPSELTDVLSDLRNEGKPISGVEARYVGLFTTYCWTMPATPATVTAHIKRFKLVQVRTTGVEVDRIHERFHEPGLGPRIRTLSALHSRQDYPVPTTVNTSLCSCTIRQEDDCTSTAISIFKDSQWKLVNNTVQVIEVVKFSLAFHRRRSNGTRIKRCASNLEGRRPALC